MWDQLQGTDSENVSATKYLMIQDCGSCVVTVLGDSGERWWNVDRVESKVSGHPGGPYRVSPGFSVLQVPGLVKVETGLG